MPHHLATEEGAPSAARRPSLRGVVALLPCAFSAFAGCGLIALAALLMPRFTRKHLHSMVRAWGAIPLALTGVRVELSGREHLDAPGPKLVLFNHVSLLDLFLLASILPPYPMALYKREMGRVPLLGWCLRAMGSIPIDRRDHARAIASITQAGEALIERGGTLFVSPEGTRSRAGGLQPFKLGAFHLAARHHVPVVPVILRDVESCLPMGALIPRAGTVRIDALAPIDTRGWSAETVREHAQVTRAAFLELVPPAATYEEVRSTNPGAPAS